MISRFKEIFINTNSFFPANDLRKRFLIVNIVFQPAFTKYNTVYFRFYEFSGIHCYVQQTCLKDKRDILLALTLTLNIG